MTREPTRSEKTYKADTKMMLDNYILSTNVETPAMYVIAALPRKQWLNCSELNENVYFFVNSE